LTAMVPDDEYTLDEHSWNSLFRLASVHLSIWCMASKGFNVLLRKAFQHVHRLSFNSAYFSEQSVSVVKCFCSRSSV
jgi:uncharacterized membrane protein